jgi:hypothetical protein
MLDDVKKLREAISQTKEPQVFFVLLSVSWGIWNILSAVICLILPSALSGYIWAGMMSCGMVTQYFLFQLSIKEKGFILISASNIGKVWLVIMISIFQVVFVLNFFAKVINPIYTLGIVAVFVGLGMAISGILAKSKMLLILGLAWIAASNLYVFGWTSSLYIHIGVVFITLIAAPVVKYVIEKRNFHD